MADDSRWRGKVAFVSGAGRGIGAAIAISLAKRGVRVAVNDLVQGEDLERTVAACRAAAGEAWGVPSDVACLEKFEGAFGHWHEQAGGLDLVVANAAYSDRELFYEANLEGFRRTIDVTMWGPFHVIRTAARAMISAGSRGAMAVVSSTHASRPIPGSMAYNMAKAAVEQLVKTAATELVEHGIRVNAVRPGWVDTPGERKFFSEETLAAVGRGLPMGRLQRAEEIAEGIVWTLDPANESLNGSIISLDGGIELPVDQLFRVRKGRAQS